MFLLSLLACPKMPLASPEPKPIVRVIDGPWSESKAISVAVTGPRGQDGRISGPAILMVTFVGPNDVLWFSTSLNSGHGWKLPVFVAREVSMGIKAQGRPEVLLALGQTQILAISGGLPVLSTRTQEGWIPTLLEEGAQTQALDGMTWGGSTLVAWTDPRGPSLRLWWDGKVEVLAEGADLDLCSRPALGLVDDRPVLAWRQGGALLTRALSQDFEWNPVESQPLQAPECDGPLFVGPHLVTANRGQLSIDGKQVETLVQDPWQVAQPRGLGVWVERDGDSERVFADGTPLLTAGEGELELWSPADVSGELWVPFTTSSGLTVAGYSPPLADAAPTP
ncbi:MAG: hypothetical protein ACI9VR_004143 [Cognaticolwellia sp.]|jgi:hypothetical protein